MGEEKTFPGEQDCYTFNKFTIKFSGHNKIWEQCTRMPPVATCLVQT